MKWEIKSLSAEAGAVDCLKWMSSGQLRCGVVNEHILLTKWKGRLALYRDPVSSGVGPGAATHRMTLPAAWDSEEDHSRVYPSQQHGFRFSAELPGDSLSRIENFRDGAALHARMEGSFQFLRLGGAQALHQGIVDEILTTCRRANHTMWFEVAGESIELTPEHWVRRVLSVLRQREIESFHIVIPKLAPSGEAGRRIVGYLRDAQQEFDVGRYTSAMATLYMAIEALQHLLSDLKSRRGEVVRRSASSQLSALKTLANEARHDRPVDSIKIDRGLAEHLFSATCSIARVVLRD